MRKWSLMVGVSTVTLGFVSAAWAQSSPPVDATQGAPAGLEEVVVTAQRRVENLQRAPIAISVVQGDAIREAGINSPAQLSNLVPALQVGQTLGPYSNFFIRGVGNLTSNAVFESAVAFNFDGVYIGRPSATNSFFYDVERVEVLKGPQGTLYGRNATGGAINILPAPPKFEPEASVTADIGNYDARRIDAMVNVPLSSTVAMRVAGFYGAHAGYMQDGTDDQDQKGARVQLLYQPSSDLDVKLTADYFEMGGRGNGATPVAPGLLDTRAGVLSPQGLNYISSLFNVLSLSGYAAPAGVTPFVDGKFWGVNATINYRTDFGTFTLIPSYRAMRQVNRSAVYTGVITQHETDNQHSVEARYASPDDNRLQALIGGYYFKEGGHSPTLLVNYGYALQDDVFKLGTESFAGFGRLTYKVLPDVKLTGGLRLTHEAKSFTGGADTLFDKFCLNSFPPGCPAAVPFPFGLTQIPNTTFINGASIPTFGADGTITVGSLYQRPDAKLSVNKLTYRLAADWDITPDSLLYASFETGFKSGGFFF
ncbi:MAG: TonB-dependent receptor, partial [Rhodospirillaceae bacterium]